MSNTRPTSAKIIQHNEGLGAPNSEQVRKRADELATIAGRVRSNEEDWRQAKRELQGGHEDSADGTEMEMSAMISGRDMVAGSLGRHVENLHADGGESVGEELVAEGMDEAEHEQMLMAHRAELPDED